MKYYKAYEVFARETMELAKTTSKLSGEKTDEKIIIKNFKKYVIPFAGLMNSWDKGQQQNQGLKESDLGLTYKKGKTVKVTHKKSGKELVIVDKPNVRKEYEKIGFFAEGWKSESVDEDFGGELKGKNKEKFEKARKENAEVLGFKLTGITDIKEAVVKATKATQQEFPDRQLLGEDVIWIGNEENGFLSSHRILSKATHQNDVTYGPATGKKIVYRVIADCACRNNQVYDEWLVRDQGAIIRQIGLDPKKYAANLIQEEGGAEKSSIPFNENTPLGGDYISPAISNDNMGTRYADILKSIMNKDIGSVENNYDRAIQQE
jgi:hypothetical protein